MGEAIRHRGPDGDGIYRDENAGYGVVHRRLAIIDLSEAGAQPMQSANGRFMLAYNGEIYNHLELRDTLESSGSAPKWRGHSDTETLLACISTYGLMRTLDSVRGMFAFALWDREDRTLTLARDRLGEKPMYFGKLGDRTVFASELAAIHAIAGNTPPIDPEAVAALLTWHCIPAPKSIWKDLQKLQPGHLVTIEADGQINSPKAYWELSQVIEATAKARSRPFVAKSSDAEIEAVLMQVVRDQCLSDVPLGAFLSGGIDSSLITALMVAGAAGPVRTYSVGFENQRFNEAPAARRVANHLGTDHTEFILTEKDALAATTELGALFSEPFADSSQIPTLLLSRLTRNGVTVALSGDGGDEMFGGYNRHVMAPRLWQQAARLPRSLRRTTGGLGKIAARGARRMASVPAIGRATARAGLPVTTLDRLGHISHALGSADTLSEFYAGLVSAPVSAASLLTGDYASKAPFKSVPAGLTAAEGLMFQDTSWYLPEDVLVKVDRSMMSASLETRAPFLDPLVVKAAWQLPEQAKICEGQGKNVLRRILSRHVPESITNAPKRGFAVPLDDWLRGALRDWSGDHIFSQGFIDAAGLDRTGIDRVWSQHQSGAANFAGTLWSLTMLAVWMTAWQTPTRKSAC